MLQCASYAFRRKVKARYFYTGFLKERGQNKIWLERREIDPEDILKKTAKRFQGVGSSSAGPSTECDVVPHLRFYVSPPVGPASPWQHRAKRNRHLLLAFFHDSLLGVTLLTGC